ncbi:MAG: toll/interleukin-1 receptor domain-containing protein [Nitrosomonas sp.]|nr:toll/interleukin-1 receptor domain-containing protein [Nitrosomonas sp.]
MLVFISYPRELVRFAEILDIELSNRNIDTFIDKNGIPPGATWSVEIDKYIHKADLFVVLYSTKALENPEKFFQIEVDLIERYCKSDNNLKLITIVFPPTKPNDLRPFFKARQYLLASENEFEAHNWVHKILQEISKLKEIKSNQRIEEIEKKWKFKWHISVFIILLLAILLVVDEIDLLITGGGNTTNGVNGAGASIIKPPSIGETVCNSLRGKYELDHEYVFSWDANSRSIATYETTWHTSEDSCSYNEKDDFFTLKGIDRTYFDVETIIDGKYVRIATVLLSYTSEVHIINADGRLVDRIFNAVIPPEEVKKEDIRIYPHGKTNELAKSLDDDFIFKKTYEVLRARYEKHKKIRSKGCSPMRGYIGTRLAISFVCPHYSRVMVRING